MFQTLSMKKIIALALVVCCVSCSSPTLLVKKNISIQKLGIAFESGEHAMPLMTQRFDHVVDAFIDKYNAKPNRKFELYRASPKDSCSVVIKLTATRLVSSGQQATGVVVSLIGFSLPVAMAAAGAPLYIFFYYFPDVKSLTELSLSPDINGRLNQKREFVLSSPGFLKSPENQIEKHVVYFERLIGQLVTQIEKQSVGSKNKNLASE